jgi:hypothetical protein
MHTLIDVARFVHAWNAWAVLLVGCAVVGTLVVETRSHAWSSASRRAQVIFVGLVHLQVLLGLVTFWGRSASGGEVFGGNGDKALWHAILGVVAAILAAVSMRLRRHGAAYLPVLITAAGALVCATLARLGVVIIVTAVCVALAQVRRSRADAPQPPVATRQG